MKVNLIDPPRVFEVGFGEKIQMKDCAHIEMEPDEQVTFLSKSGSEYDVARKNWGFYATPSLNGRLEGFGLRGVLIKNRGTGRYFVLLVERGREDLFDEYCRRENLAVIHWMDGSASLDRMAEKLTR
jgi:hypothetical protein